MNPEHSTFPPHTVIILAIDIGTSSAKTAIFEDSARMIGRTFHQISYSMNISSDGGAEFEPEFLFECVARSIDRALETVDRVDAVTVSSFWHSILGLGLDDLPTTNVLTWADTRAGHTAVTLSESVAADEHHEHTGARIHASYPFVKMCWLRDTDPDTFSRTGTWLSFPEFFLRRITGETRTSLSMASGTGMLDRNRQVWSSEALDLAGISPENVAVIDDRPINGLKEPFRSRWPALRYALWFPAIGDGAANNLGAGATGTQRPALMIGTSGALRLMMDHIPSSLSRGLWQYYLDRDRPLVGGALSEGGGTLAWAYERLRLPDPETVNARIKTANPDQHGLTILPFLSGQRSPDWTSDARFTLHGVRAGTTSIDIVQAIMESVAFSFADILEELGPLLTEPVEVIATGNGVRKNRVWAQILADVLERPTLVPKRTESSLHGAAIYGLERLGIPASQIRFPLEDVRYEPRRDSGELYLRARERRNWLARRIGSAHN